jgi:transposase InsO family protein
MLPRRTEREDALHRARNPSENGYAESLNGQLRAELLGREVLDTLLKAEVLIDRWRRNYNAVRPQSSLAYRRPAPESRCPSPLASATPQQADRSAPLAGQP